jgi:adenosylcobinamide amidohydrolase
VGSAYTPAPTWPLTHHLGLAEARKRMYKVLGLDAKKASFLFTGADVKDLALVRKSHEDMAVVALVTAGVSSNAMRMARDVGLYYEPGTINVLVLPNMRLTDRAMARAIVTATEAKSAALQDLDVRSSYTGLVNPATGTGTDNLIVVQGTGTRIDNAGGHTKMGELIARAVHEGVTQALAKRTGLVNDRSIFHRLEERTLNLFGLIDVSKCPGRPSKKRVVAEVEESLMTGRYAGFLRSALALADQAEAGLIVDLSSFRGHCLSMAAQLAGNRALPNCSPVAGAHLPDPLRWALEALVKGAVARLQ